MNSPSEDTVLNCTEGCDGDHRHKWEIEPNPYDSDFDVMVTDSDDDALKAIMEAAEMAWDQCDAGTEKVIKIRHNKVTP